MSQNDQEINQEVDPEINPEIKTAKEIAQDKAGTGNEHTGTTDEKTEKQASAPENKDPQFSADRAGRVQLTFYSYLIMLGAIGWQFLGKMPNPQTGKVEKDMMQVQEIIDLLSILEEKTKGNLTKEEENILKGTLSNLRLNYVEELEEKK